MTIRRTIYVGTFIHCVSLKELQILEHAAVGVDDETGKIVMVEEKADEGLISRWQAEAGTVILRAGKGQFFFPGFIDTHIHASQYPNSGIFGASTLLDWLNTYTFPLESSLSHPPKATRVYSRLISRTLSHGTTTAAYYATRCPASTNILSQTAFTAGQRSFIGRCAMDSHCPDYYIDSSAAQSLQDTKACAAFIDGLDPEHKLITPIITPRFAPSCSRELMKGLGEYMASSGLPCQTHISENKAEIEFVAELFPEYDSYAGVYDAFGLLGPKTVLAHAVHLGDAELALIKARGAGVSHCPVSNSALSSGACRVRRLLEAGVKVGLGTDVSGGYSPSVLEAARQAALVSRGVEMEKGSKLGVEEVLWLATRGGAEVLGLGRRVGGFELGMEWDTVLVGLTDVPVDEEAALENGDCTQLANDVAALKVDAQASVGGSMGPVDIFGWETWPEKVAKWVYCGDDRNVLKVWVQGKLVHQRPQ